MAQKVLTWSNSLRGFQVSCLLIHVGTCIRVRIRFRYQGYDICVDLHVIYMLRIAFLDRIRGWFYYVSQEVKRNAAISQ